MLPYPVDRVETCFMFWVTSFSGSLLSCSDVKGLLVYLFFFGDVNEFTYELYLFA